MRPENKRMAEFLQIHGIKCNAKYIQTGSMAGCWRLWAKREVWGDDVKKKLDSLGFRDYDMNPLDYLAAEQDGSSCIFVRGYKFIADALVKEEPLTREPNYDPNHAEKMSYKQLQEHYDATVDILQQTRTDMGTLLIMCRSARNWSDARISILQKAIEHDKEINQKMNELLKRFSQ